MKNVLQRGNRFNLEQPKFIMNSLWCNFRKGQTRLNHELQFFRKSCKKWILWVTSEREKYTIVGNHSKTKKSTKKKKQDLAKETVRFLCHTDYARLRGFNVKILMSHVWNATYMLLSIIMLLVSSESQISLN